MAASLTHLRWHPHVGHHFKFRPQLFNVEGHGLAWCVRSRGGGPHAVELRDYCSPSSRLLPGGSLVRACPALNHLSLSFPSNASKYVCPGSLKSGMCIPNFVLNCVRSASQSAPNSDTSVPYALATASSLDFMSVSILTLRHALLILAISRLCCEAFANVHAECLFASVHETVFGGVECNKENVQECAGSGKPSSCPDGHRHCGAILPVLVYNASAIDLSAPADARISTNDAEYVVNGRRCEKMNASSNHHIASFITPWMTTHSQVRVTNHFTVHAYVQTPLLPLSSPFSLQSSSDVSPTAGKPPE